MEPRLARSISEHAVTDYCAHSSGRLTASGVSKLLHVSGQFGRFIENFSVTCEDEGYIATLYEILQNCCPNLKRLKITFMTTGMANSDEESNNYADSRPCTLDKLTSITIQDVTDYPSVSKVTQWILNSAPNLTHLSYEGDRVPDLGKNGSIKRLKLEMDCGGVSEIQGANYIRGPGPG